MKKIIVVVLILALCAGGVFIWSQKNKPKELTGEDVLAWMFEEDYNGYSEGTIELTDAINNASISFKFQADRDTQYYNGTYLVQGEESPFRIWVNTGLNKQIYSYDEESSAWSVEEVELTAKDIAGTKPLLEETFTNVAMTESDVYTLTGEAFLPQAKEYIAIVPEILNDSAALIGETCSFTIVIHKETKKVLSIALESETSSYKVVFDKYKESIDLKLPYDITEHKNAIEEKADRNTELSADALTYTPVEGQTLSDDWSAMEFMLGGYVHKLGERLSSLIATGWMVASEGNVVVLDAGKSVSGIKLKNKDYPELSVTVTVKNMDGTSIPLENGAVVEAVFFSDAGVTAGGVMSLSGGATLCSRAEEIDLFYGQPDSMITYDTGKSVYEYHSGKLRMTFIYKSGNKNVQIKLLSE